MAFKWESDNNVIHNNLSDQKQLYTESFNEKKETLNVIPVQNIINVKEQSQITHIEKPKRLRQNYSQSELNHTTLFVVGSSEIDQLPLSCCDKLKKPGLDELESMYECKLPSPILGLPKIKIIGVSCGAMHTAFWTSSGIVYTFGCNDSGALGRKPNSDPLLGPLDSEPTILNLKQPIKKVTCGDNHTLYLTYNGIVYFSGTFKDNDGPIGIADYNSYEILKHLDYIIEPIRIPLDIEGSTIISDMCSGENHCVLLCQGGNSMYTFGSNEFYQLLIWDDEQIQNPTENDIDLSILENKKLLLTWPQHRKLIDILNQESLNNNNNNEKLENKQILKIKTRGNKRGRSNEEIINQIFTGNCTTFFQTKSLRLYGSGRNAQGEVGIGKDDISILKPTELTFFRGVEISYLSGGQFFTMALVNDYVFIWGGLNYLGLSKEYKELLNNINDEDYIQEKDELNTNLIYEELNNYVNKKRKLDDTGIELDNLDILEKLLGLNYENKYKTAIKLGKSTTPILLQLKEPIKTLFHGSDSLFALTLDGKMYSWGSAQNYILADGKDDFYQHSPKLIPNQNFCDCKIVLGAGGSQHTIFLTNKKRQYNTGNKQY